MSKLNCFKTYDIRGEIGINIDELHKLPSGCTTLSAKSIVIALTHEKLAHLLLPLRLAVLAMEAQT